MAGALLLLARGGAGKLRSASPRSRSSSSFIPGRSRPSRSRRGLPLACSCMKAIYGSFVASEARVPAPSTSKPISSAKLSAMRSSSSSNFAFICGFGMKVASFELSLLSFLLLFSFSCLLLWSGVMCLLLTSSHGSLLTFARRIVRAWPTLMSARAGFALSIPATSSL
jgi:hypothetical protein